LRQGRRHAHAARPAHYPGRPRASSELSRERSHCRNHPKQGIDMDKLPDLPNVNPDQLDIPSEEKLAPVGDYDHPPRILLLY
nr:hypothetical protein [Tanacetum cinerariifolium]